MGLWCRLALGHILYSLLPCRVLIFLEAQALGRALPNFALHLAQDLQAASRTLGLRALEVTACVEYRCNRASVHDVRR